MVIVSHALFFDTVFYLMSGTFWDMLYRFCVVREECAEADRSVKTN